MDRSAAAFTRFLSSGVLRGLIRHCVGTRGTRAAAKGQDRYRHGFSVAAPVAGARSLPRLCRCETLQPVLFPEDRFGAVSSAGATAGRFAHRDGLFEREWVLLDQS